jgi:hypothetical protein
MKKVSIEFEDDVHKELLKMKYEKAMKDEKITIAEIIRKAVDEFIQKEKASQN